MSTIIISIETIESIKPLTNSDNLEIVKILGTQTVVAKNIFQANEQVVFFPPDILIPEDVSVKLGVEQYLKHSIYNGKKFRCRVAACRLRGEPSYGFISKIPDDLNQQELNSYYKAEKYDPPIKFTQGDMEREPCNFLRYTNIEHYYRHYNAIEEGTLVRVTEKIHGMNSRISRIKVDDGMKIICGSHRTAKKEDNSIFWQPLVSNPSIKKYLEAGCDDIIIYGEIFGPGIQDMDYGIKNGQIEYRVFDISINGRYVNWFELAAICDTWYISLVPLIYIGPFHSEYVQAWTNGKSSYNDIKSKFKGREGCVITPLNESYKSDLGRIILKSVSADYLDRKGC